MQVHSELVNFLIYHQVLEITKARGFLLNKEQKELLAVEEEDLSLFRSFLQSKDPKATNFDKYNLGHLNFVAKREDGRQLVVFFVGDFDGKGVGKEPIFNFFAHVTKHYESPDIIIISPANLTPQAAKIIDEYDQFYTTMFMEDELLCNPATHIFAAPQQKLEMDKAGQAEFAKKMRLANGINSLPIMRENDIIARMYGYRPGDVIRFSRDCSELGLPCDVSVSYRRIAPG